MSGKKTLAPRTAFDVIPRTDETFCYICNILIKKNRTEGDEVQEALRNESRANERFLETSHFDICPLLCNAQSCFQKYLGIPRQRYHEDEVVHDTTITFDRGSFSGFPGRVGWPSIDCKNTVNPLGNLGSATSLASLEPLFQAWLYFGLLHEIFDGQFESDDFLVLNGDGKEILSLTSVLNATTSWMPTVSRAGESGEAAFMRVNGALSQTWNMLNSINGTDFNQDLRVLIASLGEVFSMALSSLFRGRNVCSGFSIFHATRPTTQLVSLGWCRSETSFKSPAIATHALYSQINRQNRRLSHVACTDTECHQGYAADQLQNNVSHRPDCLAISCHPFALDDVDQDKLCLMLEEGKFPLLHLVADHSGNLLSRLSAYEPGIRYVAISHVWAQGLGNDDANRLSMCHLHYLNNSVQMLWRLMFPNEEGQFCLWLDTICCPIRAGSDNRHRKLAIGLMRETYAKATAVLAVDTEWQQIRFSDFSPLEVASRIFISTWFKRLWTLQEGTLPLQLWFQFQNGPLNAYSLHLALRDILRSLNMRDRLAATEMLGSFMSFRILSGVYDSESQEQEMAMLTLGMAGRKVMHPGDEAICVATLIGVKTTEITEAKTPQERMKIVWLALCRKQLVPRNIVFAPGDRLKVPGFRWAYSTFRQELAPIGFRSNPSIKGTTSEHGLLVEGEGIVFKMASATQGFNHADYESSSTKEVRMLPIQVQQDKWLLLIITDLGGPVIQPATTDSNLVTWAELQDSNKEYALIRKHLPSCATSSDDMTYLLVEVKARENGLLLCSRLHIGTLYGVTVGDSISNSQACFQASVLQDHDDFRALRNSEIQGDSTTDDSLERREARLRIWQHFKFNEQLLSRDDYPEALKRTGSAFHFDARVRIALAGRYAFSVKTLPESQKWCID